MTDSSSKRPGKTEWAGRRRPMTRTSGFTSQAKVELKKIPVELYHLPPDLDHTMHFHLPEYATGERLGFGGWICSTTDTLKLTVTQPPEKAVTKLESYPDWGKFGSQWVGEATTETRVVTVTVRSREPTEITFHDLRCGVIKNELIDAARPDLLDNMWSFAPEANTYDPDRAGYVDFADFGHLRPTGADADLSLKSCNRCGRFLPINVHDERRHLSFSNHCVAPHRLPCNHSGFGWLPDADTGETHRFYHGFQLECRLCKKFEVNAQHNPQRTTAQMKEDAQRRRAFELLIEHLYERADQLRYRDQTGRELADDIYSRFNGQCFKCRTALDPREMHLDHTRPLALLWPLDETATALCASCNYQKRDRPPVEFYDSEELAALAQLTGIPLDELRDPTPNKAVLTELQANWDWFITQFLEKPELQEVRDGKRPADLLVAALRRAVDRLGDDAPLDIRQLPSV